MAPFRSQQRRQKGSGKRKKKKTTLLRYLNRLTAKPRKRGRNKKRRSKKN